jgi:hypothetical protein
MLPAEIQEGSTSEPETLNIKISDCKNMYKQQQWENNGCRKNGLVM